MNSLQNSHHWRRGGNEAMRWWLPSAAAAYRKCVTQPKREDGRDDGDMQAWARSQQRARVDPFAAWPEVSLRQRASRDHIRRGLGSDAGEERVEVRKPEKVETRSPTRRRRGGRASMRAVLWDTEVRCLTSRLMGPLGSHWLAAPANCTRQRFHEDKPKGDAPTAGAMRGRGRKGRRRGLGEAVGARPMLRTVSDRTAGASATAATSA